MYMNLDVHYRMSHRLASANYSIRDIEEMIPYERDIHIALIYEDKAKSEQTMTKGTSV